MKTTSTIIIALAGAFAAGVLSSCTAHVQTPAYSTGAATHTTTTQRVDPYVGSATTERRTTTTRY